VANALALHRHGEPSGKAGRLCAALDRCQAAESGVRARGLDRAERTVLRFLRQQQKATPAARRAA
jgi:hypothetical protein